MKVIFNIGYVDYLSRWKILVSRSKELATCCAKATDQIS